LFCIERRWSLLLVYTIIAYIIRRATITLISYKLVRRLIPDRWWFACHNHNIGSHSVYYIIVWQKKINRPSIDFVLAVRRIMEVLKIFLSVWLRYMPRRAVKVYRGIVEDRLQNCELVRIIQLFYILTMHTS